MSGMTRRDVSTAQLMKTHGYSARTDYHKDKQDAQAVRELAREILRLTRSTLLIHMRFLESALVRFVPGDETVTPEMATDGKFLYYNSIHICRLFKTSPQLVCRDYLHLTLHCIFRHLFVGEKLNGELWDLACDIAVEHLITGLGIKSLYAERQEKQSWLTDKLKEQMPRLTAERIYRYLIEQDLPPQEIGRIREYFYADDHRIWHRQPEAGSGGDRGESRDKTQNGADSASELGDMSGEDEFTPPEDGESEERRASGGSDTGERRDSGDNEGMTGQANENPGDRPAMTPQETEQMWKEISERIRVDLDTSANSYGENTGDFVSAIGEVNREKIDYAAFLRRFAVLGKFEGVTVADDFAHHPTELTAVLTSAMKMGYRQGWAVFQPHTYSRTYNLLEDFAQALSIPDHLVMTEILAVREENKWGIHTSDLAAKVPGSVWFDSFEKIADYVMEQTQPGDLILTLGGGDIYKCANLIVEKYKARQP